jgi:hypothetical protein
LHDEAPRLAIVEGITFAIRKCTGIIIYNCYGNADFVP